ncbi:hypothetical protein K438DRAFT_1802405 [Mycena galopus ATCC 62051]|nr:hypothetical protein K438DRAFT_1802405 [Mycena galopus ATCC 62051]
MVDQHFDLTLPACKQQANMKCFIRKLTVEFFPGFFNKNTQKNVKQRTTRLQAYIESYLDEKLMEPSAQPNKSKSKRIIIKVKRPRPHKAFETATESSTLLPALPIDSDPQDEPDSSTDVSEGEGDFVCPIAGRGKHRPPRVLSPSRSPSPILTDAAATDPITEFCANCSPPMLDRVGALQLAGTTEKDHLIGMARWNDDDLRTFLWDNNVAQNPLEERALMIGFKCILMESL